MVAAHLAHGLAARQVAIRIVDEEIRGIAGETHSLVAATASLEKEAARMT